MSRICLFDLYDTVLKDVSFDFQRGMRWLYDTYFADRCSWEAFLAYEDTFYPLYQQRTVDNHEIMLIRDEVIPIFAHFGVALPEDLREVEWQIMTHMQENTLLPAVEETLVKLCEAGCRLYILSNAVFSAQAAERYLERFGIRQYFRRVYSSADHGVRKPGRAFFDLAVSEILAENPGARREDILFMGNDYRMDAVGGVVAELNTIWYNVEHQPNTDGLPVREIDDFRKLLEGMEV